MLIVAQILGFAAVGLYFLSYQLKKRKHIVCTSFFSNVFYVSQYLLLGAFSGAIMDLLAAVASFLAIKKNAPGFARFQKWIAPAVILVIVAVGLLLAVLQRSWIEVIPVVGAAFQAFSMFCDNEQTIRKFGLCSAPCWLVYNFISKAYGAALGSVCIIISIISSLIRYRQPAAEPTHE